MKSIFHVSGISFWDERLSHPSRLGMPLWVRKTPRKTFEFPKRKDTFWPLIKRDPERLVLEEKNSQKNSRKKIEKKIEKKNWVFPSIFSRILFLVEKLFLNFFAGYLITNIFACAFTFPSDNMEGWICFSLASCKPDKMRDTCLWIAPLRRESLTNGWQIINDEFSRLINVDSWEWTIG